MNRRGFLKGILAAGVAPYVVTTAGVLMPVRQLVSAQKLWAVPSVLDFSLVVNTGGGEEVVQLQYIGNGAYGVRQVEHTGTISRLEWARPDGEKVPVSVNFNTGRVSAGEEVYVAGLRLGP